MLDRRLKELPKECRRILSVIDTVAAALGGRSLVEVLTALGARTAWRRGDTFAIGVAAAGAIAVGTMPDERSIAFAVRNFEDWLAHTHRCQWCWRRRL